MGGVVVLGSINMDIVARAARAPAPGETVFGDSLKYLPGGKGANQAVAAARAGAAVRMAGMLGNDPFAATLRHFLEKENIDISLVGNAADLPSGTAIITVDHAGENSITVISGANAAIKAGQAEACALGPGDVAVAQFEVPVPAIAAFFRKAKAAGAATVLNTAPAIACGPELFALCDVVVLNETELDFYGGGKAGDPAATARTLLTSDNQHIVVTQGGDGALIVGRGDPVKVQGHKVPLVDSTGGGDCFVGNLAARLAAGDNMQLAAQKANAAGALCVQREGAGPSMPYAAEVEKFLRGLTLPRPPGPQA